MQGISQKCETMGNTGGGGVRCRIMGIHFASQAQDYGLSELIIRTEKHNPETTPLVKDRTIICQQV